MPKESMTCISEETRKRLDEFIEGNYPRLLARVRYRERDKSTAETILHDIIIKLYAGQRMLNFDGSPLRHFEYLIQNTISHALQNRQEAFEEGYQVKVKQNIIQRIPIRKTIDSAPVRNLSCDSPILQDIAQHEFYVHYLKCKARLTPSYRCILTGLEAGYSINIIQEVLAEKGIFRTQRWVREHAKELIQRVERMMQPVHSPID